MIMMYLPDLIKLTSDYVKENYTEKEHLDFLIDINNIMCCSPFAFHESIYNNKQPPYWDKKWKKN